MAPDTRFYCYLSTYKPHRVNRMDNTVAIYIY